MNKSLRNLTRLTSALFFAAAIVSCNNNQPKAVANSDSNAAAVSKSDKIVFVNSDSLLNNYEYFKNIRSSFEEKSKKAQLDLNAKGTAFQREVAEYQKNAATMSADERNATQQRLARKQQELATYNQNASSALQNEESAENEKLYNKVADFLKTYAKTKGYKMVLTYSKGNPTILFADSTLDVTKEVVTGLNEVYKKEKK